MRERVEFIQCLLLMVANPVNHCSQIKASLQKTHFSGYPVIFSRSLKRGRRLL